MLHHRDKRHSTSHDLANIHSDQCLKFCEFEPFANLLFLATASLGHILRIQGPQKHISISIL